MTILNNKFYTEVEIPPCQWKIDYQSKLVMMGSCFTENIGKQLERLKFDIDLNPFGILYNPLSVSNSLQRLMSKKIFSSDELFFDQGTWNSFSHHGSFSGTNRDEVLTNINQHLIISSEMLRNANLLIITYGTSWVYEYKKTGKIVSNCHKIPAREFNRYRLTTDQIVDDFISLYDKLLKINKKIKVLFTISPIRHWKDGAIENQLSKSTLLLAINQLINAIGNDKIYYFPSYEIVMDELRDYRYYATDMLHLSELAVEYIYSKFSQLIISESTLEISEKILKLQKAVEHRPLNPASNEYKKFAQKNLSLIKQLTQKHSFLNLQKEKAYFLNCLSILD